MPLAFIDSVDHYATADLPRKYSSVGNQAVVQASNGRRGGGCLNLPWASGASSQLARSLPPSAHWIIGFALQTDTLPGAGFLALLDAGTTQVALRLDANGALAALRGATVLGSTPPGAIASDAYAYIELRALIHPTAGALEIRINGAATPALLLTNINTRSSANSSADLVRFGASSSIAAASVLRIDDIYIVDASSAPADFLGDVRIDAYRPNADGSSTQFAARVGAAANFAAVNESSPNGDTSYVESATVGNRDLYQMADMTHTPAVIHGVQVVATAMKSDAGARALALPVSSAGTVSADTAQALSTTYQMYRRIVPSDPATGAAWTRAAINAAEVGVEVV